LYSFAPGVRDGAKLCVGSGEFASNVGGTGPVVHMCEAGRCGLSPSPGICPLAVSQHVLSSHPHLASGMGKLTRKDGKLDELQCLIQIQIVII